MADEVQPRFASIADLPPVSTGIELAQVPTAPPPTSELGAPSELDQAKPGDVVSLTPEQQAEFDKSAGIVNPLRDLSPEQIVELARSDPKFNIVESYASQPQLAAQPEVKQKAADAWNLLKQSKGILSDLPGPGEILKNIGSAGIGFAKYMRDAGRLIVQPNSPEARRGVGENIAASELGLNNLIDLGKHSLATIGRALPGTKSLQEFTPDEKLTDFGNALAEHHNQQQITAGHGPILGTKAGQAAQAEHAALPLRPEEVAAKSAGDPFSWWAAGKAFGLAGKAAGAVVPEAATAAIGRGAQATGEGLAKVAGRGLAGVADLTQMGAKAVAKVAPAAGAVGGAVLEAEKHGPIVGGFAGYKAGQAVAAGLEKVGKVTRPIAEIGKQIAGVSPMTSSWAQFGKDILESTPAGAIAVGKGAAFDLGLAATAETPEEARGVGFGTAFGLAGAAHGVGGRVLSGQIIAPRAWGAKTVVPSSGQFPALDVMHTASIQDSANPGFAARINAVRAFARGIGADVFYGSSPEAIQKGLESSGVDTATAQKFAAQDGFFTADLPGKDGTNRRVIVVRNADTAPHEAIHALDDVMGESANREFDQFIQQQYGQHWEQIGQNYAHRLDPNAAGDWRDTVLRFSGWDGPEAVEKLRKQVVDNIQSKYGDTPYPADANEETRKVWQSVVDQHGGDQSAAAQFVLTPSERAAIADRYIAREVKAEAGDALFKAGGGKFDGPPGILPKLARVVANLVSMAGGEPLAGRTSEQLGVPLQYETTRKVGENIRGALPAIEPKNAAALTAKPVVAPGGLPTTPEAKASAADEARTIAAESPDAPVAGGTKSPRELLGTMAEAIADQSGVKINYLSAPNEPAAATTSNRDARRAMIEIFRTMPESARALWEKTFFPERVLKTKGGQYQVLGWAPEVFASNAHKLAGTLADINRPELSPYPIDPKTRSFTPDGWQQLYSDTQKFVANQIAGRTGAGGELVVPKNVLEKGYTQPALKPGVEPLEQGKADFINMLYNFKLPETPRIQKGKLPLNIAGQEVSAATQPGRVEPPVQPREAFAGPEAERQGIAGREILEVNPTRNAIEQAARDAGKPMPSFIESVQRLNLSNIKEVEHAPEQPEFRGNTLALTAGFAPNSDPRAIKEAAIKMPDDEIFTGSFHGDSSSKAENTGRYNTDDFSKAVEGFITNDGKFLDRKEAYVRATELRQIEPQTYKNAGVSEGVLLPSENPDWLETRAFERSAQFSPAQAVEQLKTMTPEEYDAIRNFKGRFGGGGTGWAYEVGASARTPEDLSALQHSREVLNDMRKDAMANGDINQALFLGTKAQLAREAYEAATGHQIGAPEQVGSALAGIRNYDPNYTPPLSPKSADKNLVAGIAENYAKQAGIKYAPPEGKAQYNRELGTRIADFFDAAEHAPNDPEVRASYDSFSRETIAQAKVIQAAGIDLEPVSSAESKYRSGADAARDIRDNKHLFFNLSEATFGPKGQETKDNLLLKPSGIELHGQEVSVNDLFRAVHDFFGHSKEELSFGPRGEFNAWREHSALYSPEAQGALAAETIGQTAWTQLGPHLRGPSGELLKPGEPGFTPRPERPYAVQKNIVLPPELINEAKTQAAPKSDMDEVKKLAGRVLRQNAKNYAANQDEFSVTLYRDDKGRLKANKPVAGSESEVAVSETGKIAGVVHTHPGGLAELTPADEEFGQSKADELGKPFYVGVIGMDENGNTVLGDNVFEPTAQAAPKKKISEPEGDWKFKPSTTGFSKAWIMPNGKPVQLGSQWHHEWLNANPDVREKYGIPESDSAEDNRVDALKKGFARLNYGVNNGTLTVEARARDWRKLKGAVENLVDKNLGAVDNMTVNLTDDAAKTVVDSDSKRLFELPKQERMANLPLITGSEPRAQFSPMYSDNPIEEANMRRAERYFSIGHENPGSVVWMYDSANRRVKTGKGGSHAMSFGSGVADNTFKGWFDPEESKVSVAFPRHEAYKLGHEPTTDDIPDGVFRAIQNKFGKDPLIVAFSPAASDKFSDPGFAESLDSVRSGKSGGQTFNPDGSIWTPKPKTDVVTMASVNIPQGELTKEKLLDAVKPYADLLDEPNIAAGVFSFSKDGKPTVSIDINALVPQKYRANSVDFGKANDQVSIWDADKGAEVATGGKGNTKLQSVGELLDALDNLSHGKPVDVAEIMRQHREAAPAEEQGALFGGKSPLSPQALSQMTKAEIAQHYPEAVIPRRRNESIPSRITESPLYKEAKTEAEASEAFGRRLAEFAREYETHPVYQAGRKWYSEFAPQLRKEFGSDAPIMAELLAATSPNTNVETNFGYAYDALRGMQDGRFDKQIAKFEDGLSKIADESWEKWYRKELKAGNIPDPPAEPTPAAFLEAWIAKYDLKPRQSNGKLFGQHSIPVLQVFARRWLDLNRGPKTANFVQNLLGDGHDATIDIWADRTMRRIGYSGYADKWRILPQNKAGVSDADFAFSQKAFANAAKQLGMKPDELQAALWFSEKQLWADEGWGRLDLGDFRSELAKVPLLKQGYGQRLAATKARAAASEGEQLGLQIEPRKLK